MKANKLICLLILLSVLQNIPYTKQLKNGQGINLRKLNDFDYDFKDWEVDGAQNNLFDYNIDLDNLGNMDAVTNTFPQTNTTPIIYVTIPTAPKEEPTTATATITPNIFPETTTVFDIGNFTSVATDNTIKESEVSVLESTNADITTNDTVLNPTQETSNVSTPSQSENATETTELIMTFPETSATESQWTTLPPHLTTYRISYPPDMTFPEFGSTMSQPPPFPKQEFPTIPIPTTTESAIVREFNLDMEQINGGYLTTFLLEMFKIIGEKSHESARFLFHALEREITELEATRKLDVFGRSTVAALVASVQMLNSVPAEVIQSQASLGKYLMMNRDSLGPDIESLFEEADKLYRPEEGKNILKVVEDLYDYPNKTKTAKMIVHEMIDAVILAPLRRMYGTTKEKFIVQQLDELVIKMFFSGYPVQGRRRQSDKQTTEVTRKKKNITTWNQRTKKIKTSPTGLTTTTTTIRTTIPNRYAAFSKNITIRDAFKQRMMRYKRKRDPNRWRQWRSRRTTPKTTTEKPTRVTRKFKSIYVIKRYVHKKMKKRKVKIIKNESDTFELVDFEDDLVASFSKTTLSIDKPFQKTLYKEGLSTKNIPFHKKGFSQIKSEASSFFLKDISPELHKKGIKRDSTVGNTKIQRKRLPIKDKKLVNSTAINNKNLKAKERRRWYPDISRRYTILQRNNLNKDLKLRTFLPKHDNVIEDSSLSEEEKLKANLDDALFHEKPIQNTNFKNLGRRKIDSSYSDDEAILKSRIYKVFGYESDFAEALRQEKWRRQFI